MLNKYLEKHGLNETQIEKDKMTSRVYPFDLQSYQWGGVDTQAYKPEGNDFAGIIRQVVIGYREQTAFHVRYFEIAPGGNSSLEKHEHTHVVIGVRGQGKVIMGTDVYDVNFMDTFYVAPKEPHQFVNLGEEPFGFICIVDSERDRPQPLTEDELVEIKKSPAAEVVREEKVILEKV